MAFGQQSGPPASHRQVQTLVELVAAAGHSDLRDARGPLGLTQRQAAGKFTRDEADALIARLEAADGGADGAAADPGAGGDGGRVTSRSVPAPPKPAAPRISLRRIPDDLLAAELQRRGWIVVAP